MDALAFIGTILTSHVFAVAAFFAVALSPLWLKKFQTISALQSTAVSLGILGTFLGIFGGMLQFDINDLDASIKLLLEGLRLAFLTPIAGIGTALIVRTFPQVYGIKETEESRDEHELVQIKNELAELTKALTGDGETTLLTQVQKLRQSMTDKMDDLNKSFKDFAEKMVEDNKASLIEALQQVIKDFNEKITEQFGENFKHLNDGVGKMLEWQENYTKQVEKAVEVLDKSGESLQISAEALQSAKESIQEFKSTADELKKQLEAMGASMVGMKTLAESLKDSGADIRKEMEEITTKNINFLGEKLASISEKLVSDYSQLQQVIQQIVSDGQRK